MPAYFPCAALMRAQSFSFSETISKMSSSARRWYANDRDPPGVAQVLIGRVGEAIFEGFLRLGPGGRFLRPEVDEHVERVLVNGPNLHAGDFRGDLALDHEPEQPLQFIERSRVVQPHTCEIRMAIEEPRRGRIEPRTAVSPAG